MFTVMHMKLCSFGYMFLNKLPVHVWAFSRFVDKSGSSDVMNIILSTRPQK